ncbi:MAG: branched-chain amino acid ABC transporter permease [Flavobacteriaceae bacterium]
MTFIWRWFGLAACLFLLVLPQFTNPYIQYMVNLVLVYVILGIGLNFLLGYAGQFAFAHAALMGIGAYTTAIVTYRLGLSYWLALPLSGITAMIVGSLGALPAMRMKRVYLALVTLAFAELLHWVFVHWKPVTAGTDGMSVRSPEFFGYSLRGDDNTFYVLLVILIFLYIIARRIVESRIGRSFVAIRENEIVAQSCGISVGRTKALVFALSAFYAGIGGSMFALTLGYIVPDSFNLFQLVVHFSIVVIGGLISIYGSIIGAVILTALPELLRDFQALQEIIYGVLLMVFIIFMPSGIAGVAKRIGILPDEILSRNWRRLKTAPGRQPQSDDGKA